MGIFESIPGVIEKGVPAGARTAREHRIAIDTHSVHLGGLHQVSPGVDANGVETQSLPAGHKSNNQEI